MYASNLPLIPSGVAVSLVLLCLYGVNLFVAFSVSAIFVGEVILRGRPSPVLAALLLACPHLWYQLLC